MLMLMLMVLVLLLLLLWMKRLLLCHVMHTVCRQLSWSERGWDRRTRGRERSVETGDIWVGE